MKGRREEERRLGFPFTERFCPCFLVSLGFFPCEQFLTAYSAHRQSTQVDREGHHYKQGKEEEDGHVEEGGMR